MLSLRKSKSNVHYLQETKWKTAKALNLWLGPAAQSRGGISL